jgi:N-acetylglucosaminyl-diphospho-decaprenol L-rhamnosyltransferase
MTNVPQLSISIVVHNQAVLARQLLEDIAALGNQVSVEVLFTVNTDESLPFTPHDYRFPLRIIRNPHPKGFGANHNFAFKMSRADFYCVLNPDIRLIGNPFPPLIDCLKTRGSGVVGPSIINPAGLSEASARRFPTPWSILKKAICGSPDSLDYHQTDTVFEPDWIGGMFMVFTRRSFETIGGFDERYFLYYEDVDICTRLKMARLPVLKCPEAKAVHDGRADSHHDLKYLQWHLRSMVRYFTSKGFWKLAAWPQLRD